MVQEDYLAFQVQIHSTGGLPGIPGTDSTGELPGIPGTDSTGELPGFPGTDSTGGLPGVPGTDTVVQEDYLAFQVHIVQED